MVEGLDSWWMAMVVGLVTSPHCVLMCGPLSYVVIMGKEVGVGGKELLKRAGAYHIGRVISFSIVGGMMGWIGEQLLGSMGWGVVGKLPWVLVVFLVLFGLGVMGWVGKVKGMMYIFGRIAERVMKLPRVMAGFLLGLMTPLMPCGPLYGVYGVGGLSGSVVFSFLLSLGFVLGTVPLPLMVQMGYGGMAKRMNPRWVSILQRVFALVMAGWIVWRMRNGGGIWGGEVGCCGGCGK